MEIYDIATRLKQAGYSISDDKDKLQIDVIHNFLKNSYWSPGIPYKTVQEYIQHSACFGVFFQNTQIGFARVITDYTTFGYIADVFVLKEHRGKGISKWLMNEIINHDLLKGFRRWMLATADAHALYKQFGFTGIKNPEMLMEKYNPDVYKKE